jgi:hypothetical protein
MYMQHTQEIPINITHVDIHIMKINTRLVLIFYRLPPTTCKPSTILPALDHVAQNSQQWVTPEVGVNFTQVKGFLARLRKYRQHEGFHTGIQLKITTYNLSFPTFHSHPRKCSPSLLNNPSASPLPF